MSRSALLSASDVLRLVRSRAAAHSALIDTQRPFRFLLCGDPALVAELRALLLAGHEGDHIPLEAAATLETIDPARAQKPALDARAVIFLGRPGDRAAARLEPLTALNLPVFAITVDPEASAVSAPATAPLAGLVGDYTVPRLDRASLRQHCFTHISVDRCKGVEISVGRNIPALRQTVAAKPTRIAAASALKIAAASAVVDHIPILGAVLGAVASAGDMVAITGIQIALTMQIGAAYNKDVDLTRVWELLPIVGGGFGWRLLLRELDSIPVSGRRSKAVRSPTPARSS